MHQPTIPLAPAARLEAVTKDHPLGSTVVRALRGVNLELGVSAFAVICGPSGSGKSTLLNLLGCLDTPTAGQIEIAGQNVGRMSERERSAFRAHHVGFVFQNFNLIPVLTVLENVEYPLQLSEPNRQKRHQRAVEALVSVGLGEMLQRRPSELSGGQRQRVAVARALVKRPALVLADEPTANLDRKTGSELIALMRTMQRDSGTTFVFSSHDPQLIADADTRIELEDGLIVRRTDRQPEHITPTTQNNKTGAQA